jgi:hypothetical protein
MAISMLSSTIMLITEYEPKVSSAQNLVKLLMPVSSKVVRSTSPNDAQKSDWEVSNKLESNELRHLVKPMKRLRITYIIIITRSLMSPLLGHRPSLWITHKENGP